jgi:hypothetical protein
VTGFVRRMVWACVIPGSPCRPAGYCRNDGVTQRVLPTPDCVDHSLVAAVGGGRDGESGHGTPRPTWEGDAGQTFDVSVWMHPMVELLLCLAPQSLVSAGSPPFPLMIGTSRSAAPRRSMLSDVSLPPWSGRARGCGTPAASEPGHVRGVMPSAHPGVVFLAVHPDPDRV